MLISQTKLVVLFNINNHFLETWFEFDTWCTIYNFAIIFILWKMISYLQFDYVPRAIINEDL